MKTVLVNADALLSVLQAITGSDHEIRGLQAIRRLSNSPIDVLLGEYNAAVEEEEKEYSWLCPIHEHHIGTKLCEHCKKE